MIPNIYHFFNIEENYEFTYFDYFSIKSLIEINKPDIIYYHYYYLPIGDYWNKIKDNIELKKINIPDKYYDKGEYLNKNIKLIIYHNLYNYGGIRCNLNMLFTKNINELLINYEYIYDESYNKIIMCSKKSKIIKKYMEKHIIKSNEEILISNYTDKYLCLFSNNYYNLENNDNDDFFFKNIIDYSFSKYFHIINNCYFLFYQNQQNQQNQQNKQNQQNQQNKQTIYNLKYLFDNVTIYSLLIKYILGYNFMYNSLHNMLEYEDKYKDKNKYINNLDTIIWINLDRCVNRKIIMNKLLNNFNVNNYRFNAFDGKIIDDVKNKYFISEDGIYPNNNNAEYATLLSHLSCIELYSESYNNVYNYALICEDDLSLDFIKYWKFDLKTVIKQLKDFDILMLGYYSTSINHKDIYNNWSGQMSCMAYIVNKKSIKDKIKDLKIDGKWKCNQYDLMIADHYIYSKFKTYYYKYPYFCNPNINDSNIHDDHLDYHILYKNMNYMTLEEIYNKYI